ncbi:glycosyltransferase family 4 protein [Candidatus Falkowbacteria bacterium]|nr:glycosyltransferase family 4 protein [Candidatus Falkowbacteria bacterium]
MKKKILYITTESELGGSQRYILDLARNLKNEYDIVVVFGSQNGDGEFGSLLEKAGINYFVLPHLVRRMSPLHDFLAYRAIKKLIRDIRPNIVHLSSRKASTIGSFAVHCQKSGSAKPLVVYSPHGWAFNEPDSSLSQKIFLRLERYTQKYKDKIICINKSYIEQAEKLLHIDPRKLSLIYHGIDIKQYQYYAKEDAKKRLFSLIENAQMPDEKTILVGSIGNLYPSKGYYYLIKAMHYLIIDYGFPITAILIGEGPERGDLEARIIKFHPMDYNAMDGNVSQKIILAGRIANAAEILPAFDFYVSTSLKEGFPYTILEAMGAGLPVIATRVGGIPDMITDQVNGLLIDPQNSRTLASKVAELINDPSKKQRLATQAQHDANHLFKFNKMLEQTKKIYEG